MTRPRRPGLRTPSLRRRVTLLVLALLGVMLLTVGVVTDVVLEKRLDSQLRQRLADRASIATALVDTVDARDLARRLEGDGVSAVVTTSGGRVFAEGPLGGSALDGTPADERAQTPSAAPGGPGPGGSGDDSGDDSDDESSGPGPSPPAVPKANVVQTGNLLSVTRSLSNGSTVQLLADVTDIQRTLGQVRLALVLAALVVLAGAAVAVPPVVARALRPLDRITDVARSITRGDRARRLRPVQPDTELGRTAVAFDDMLDAVLGAESRAVGSEGRLRDFLSDAAHELRTPVAGVQVAAEHLLRDDPPREEREQTLLGLVRESRRAGRLVNDMLTMARIDSGLSLGREPVDLRAVVEEAASARMLAHPGLTLEVVGGSAGSGQVGDPDGARAVVSGDRDRLTQVVGNLLDNALHVARSRVEAEVSVKGGRVLVDVRDDGPGVPATDRERIFERLVRLDESRSNQHGGAGLGLSIARGLARAHDGDLTCEPAVRGAWFRLSVPSRPEDASPRTP